MAKVSRRDFRTPRKLAETVWSDRGLSLPVSTKLRQARWPWVVLALSPFVGVGIAWLWHTL